MKNLEINNFIIEGTRKCNMSCKHCLRGDSENVDMPFSYVKKVLDAIGIKGCIKQISFSGGEPSLNLSIMKEILEYVKLNGIPVYAFWTCTNGKIYSDEFIQICNEWIFYTIYSNHYTEDLVSIDNYLSFTDYDSFYSSGIALSMDSFHESIPYENVLKLQSLKLFDDSKINNDIQYYLLNMGRAKNLKDYKKQDIQIPSLTGYLEDDFIYLEDILYLSAKGDILSCCDLSYEEQPYHAITNIKEDNWLSIIEHELEE